MSTPAVSTGLDRRFLTAIVDHYDGGPVGLEAIAATINDEAETLSELVEPYLLKIGFIVRTPNGRRVTREAYRHLGKQPPPPPRANRACSSDAKANEARANEWPRANERCAANVRIGE